MKSAAGITLSFALAQIVTFAAPEPPPPPLLKVTYAEVSGTDPSMFSYSVWPSGEVRYEPSPLDYNGVKTREARTLRVSPEAALRAANELINVGFLALQPKVRGVSAASDEDVVLLERIAVTHSQQVLVEFYFENEEFKIDIERIELLPWAQPALRKVEKDLGIAALVE